MKEKYLRPAFVNARTLEFEGAFPLAAVGAVAAVTAVTSAAKVATAALKVSTAVKVIQMPRPYFGLKNFRRLNFENN